MNEFIIVFRECLEASLIVGIIYTILAKSNLRDAIQKLWLGVAASLVASLGVAYVVISLKDALGNNSSMALFEAIFMYITAGLIWYVVFWLSKHVSDRKVLEGQTMTAVKISSWGVFFVTFFAILREGFETVVFLISSFSITESFSYVGFIVGAALAILLGYLVVVQGKRINLKRFFQGTTLLLVFLASGMVAYGTHEVESYLVKSNQLNKDNISRPWDILKPKTQLEEGDSSSFYSYDDKKKLYTHVLHDSGSVGVFLKGFFGYNSNPNYIELVMWIMSLVYGLNLWRRFYY
ncbi:FTR1 family protein [bacterium]|nr:FTR1 family protein [bacterium]